jgi:hypothetical protein
MNAQLPTPNSQKQGMEAHRLGLDLFLGVGSWELGVDRERFEEMFS